MVNGECPTYLRNIIELVDKGIISRQKDNIRIKRCRTIDEQKMLFYNGLIMYNNLPLEIKREEKFQKIASAIH